MKIKRYLDFHTKYPITKTVLIAKNSTEAEYGTGYWPKCIFVKTYNSKNM
jgi:hypothetical protein